MHPTEDHYTCFCASNSPLGSKFIQAHSVDATSYQLKRISQLYNPAARLIQNEETSRPRIQKWFTPIHRTPHEVPRSFNITLFKPSSYAHR